MYVIICILYDSYVLYGNVCVCNYLYPVRSICILLKWHLLYIMAINYFFIVIVISLRWSNFSPLGPVSISLEVSRPQDYRFKLSHRFEFYRNIGRNAAEVPIKFQSDRTILNTNHTTSSLEEILRQHVLSDIETGHGWPRLVVYYFSVFFRCVALSAVGFWWLWVE